eukprot:TRINITY_DN15657_c4_g1_i1.p1 TRINITY_DN15657_c4_g1~~TRINITY_DN15657_c4_g1_i1.p1  ORF type:complete len:190 (+),score=24.27 TRINITY_DN15657_c4_g1_i1:42-572(+)
MLRVCLLFVAAAGVLAEDMKDNWVYFDGNGTVKVNFSLTTHAVSSGQPWGGVSVQGDGLLVKAGRHGTTSVAAAFVDGLSLLNVLPTEHALDALPHDLNFAIFGNLTLTFGTQKAVCSDFRIAQGHYSTHNNWWMGSPTCEATPTTQRMTCLCHGTNVQFHSSGSSDHINALPTSG